MRKKIAQTVAAAVRHGVSVTPRGKGTGNYGQAIPLAGGLVLDMSKALRAGLGEAARKAPTRELPDFAVRHGLDAAQLIDLFAWSAEEFGSRMAGSPIHRIGYERWSRNLAVGLGNAPRSPRAVEALRARSDDPSPLVREHVAWALAQQQGSRA